MAFQSSSLDLERGCACFRGDAVVSDGDEGSSRTKLCDFDSHALASSPRCERVVVEPRACGRGALAGVLVRRWGRAAFGRLAPGVFRGQAGCPRARLPAATRPQSNERVQLVHPADPHRRSHSKRHLARLLTNRGLAAQVSQTLARSQESAELLLGEPGLQRVPQCRSPAYWRSV